MTPHGYNNFLVALDTSVAYGFQQRYPGYASCERPFKNPPENGCFNRNAIFRRDRHKSQYLTLVSIFSFSIRSVHIKLECVSF